MVKFLLLAGGAKGSAISRLVKELDKGKTPVGSLYPQLAQWHNPSPLQLMN